MTIRLLTPYDKYPVNAIVTLDAGTESGLVAAKMASTTTTGGVTYVAPVILSQRYPAQIEVDNTNTVAGLVHPKTGVTVSLGGGGGAGTPGADGKTILNGTGAPSAGLGNNGDFYIDTAASVIYGPKASGAWPGSGVSMSATAAGPDVLADVTASFNIGATHANQTVPVNSASAVVATIVPDSTTTLAIGTTVTLVRKGTGGVSFQEGAGVTLRFSRSRSAYAVGSMISVKKLAANDWVLTGEQL